MNPQMQPGVDGCWQAMGRPGPGTCPELGQHVVCRNCRHYAAAALRLLDRAAPADYVREWTDHLAGRGVQTAHATTCVMVFRVGSEWLALPTSVVEQVADQSVVRRLPHRRSHVQGLVSIRGELVVCVSLHALLGVDERSTAHIDGASRLRSRLLVLKGADGRIAFQPNEVFGLHRYSAGDLSPLPATLVKSSAAKFTVEMFSWNGHTVGCLDADRILSALTRSLS